ncbi:polyprenyl synthetase family protein [uncultured Nocardioides sp.]|uniref:polyprenyl synthetase family protein n=1 Tax=uncultured Nocardioides sp. TaxID=198441 RepID=UPI00261D1938|nr:polyprenyl synthetase family protein [uncultured Nocardioides sp.]
MPDSDDATFRAAVSAQVAGFLDSMAPRLEPLGADAARLLAEARTATAGGKRLRAAFCWWGYRAVRPDVVDETALLRACASLELLHASALVHDDYMDASDTRRGHPAAHRALEAEHRAAGWSGPPERYGAAGAILLGDLLLSWSDEMLRRCGLPAEQVGAALDVLDLCRTEVIAGQFLDISVQARGLEDVAEAMTVLRYKSAKYSVEQPLHLGAALAGADTATQDALGAFGLPLGEAFQLRDDLLGVFGDPAVTGKPAGDDLVEGKQTVLVALALDGLAAAGRTADRDELAASLGRPHDAATLRHLQELIVDSGAEAQVEEAITGLVTHADAALDRAGLDETATAALRALGAAATSRTA